jgi:prevent-host-death family protein
MSKHASQRVSITEARRSLRSLFRKAQRGTPIEITNRGEVVARLVKPASDAAGTADALLRVRAGLKEPARGHRGRMKVSFHKNLALTSRKDG